MAKLPQREGRPSLDISPEDSIPDTAGWAEKFTDPMNPLNKAVPERKEAPEPNGWVHESGIGTKYSVDLDSDNDAD